MRRKLYIDLSFNDLINPEAVEVRVPNSATGWSVLHAPLLEYMGSGEFEGVVYLPEGTEYKFLISPLPGFVLPKIGQDANGIWVRDPHNPNVANEGEWNENSIS